MKTINVPFEKEEHETLVRCKGEMTWRELINKSAWFMGVLHREAKMEFGEGWEINPPVKIEKPCHTCGYCPYGQLVEAFPCHKEAWQYGVDNNILSDDGYPDLNKIIPEHPELDKLSCEVFGHDCPAYYCAEPLSE